MLILLILLLIICVIFSFSFNNSVGNKILSKYSAHGDRLLKYLQLYTQSQSPNVQELIDKIINEKNIETDEEFEYITGLSQYSLLTGPQQALADHVGGRELTDTELQMSRNDIEYYTEKN